jgi:hypothetical protein
LEEAELRLLDFKRFRIARGVPEGEHVNGVVIFIDGVNDPMVGASADTE